MANPGGPIHELCITSPSWLDALVDWERPYTSDEERTGLVIGLARQNVLRDGGGPFGAAVFEMTTGRVVGAGVNRVQQLANSALHAEMMAIMTAQARLRSHTFHAPGIAEHALVTSCEPCAMCLGASLWSGVRRLVYGAPRTDVIAVGFDEGPVFPASLAYLRERGIEIVGEVLRADARAVLHLYFERGGEVY